MTANSLNCCSVQWKDKYIGMFLACKGRKKGWDKRRVGWEVRRAESWEVGGVKWELNEGVRIENRKRLRFQRKIFCRGLAEDFGTEDRCIKLFRWLLVK